MSICNLGEAIDYVICFEFFPLDMAEYWGGEGLIGDVVILYIEDYLDEL